MRGGTACLRFDDDHRHRVMLGVTQTDPGGFHRTLFRERLGPTVYYQKRFAAFFLVHVDIAPAHYFANASPECFRDRFLRREPGREMARWKFHREAISNLALGENPLHETFAKTIERVLDALDLDHVHANAQHAHGEGISSSCALTRYNSPFARAFHARHFPSLQKLPAKQWRARC